jgi:hypothetical protein
MIVVIGVEHGEESRCIDENRHRLRLGEVTVVFGRYIDSAGAEAAYDGRRAAQPLLLTVDAVLQQGHEAAAHQLSDR